MNRYQNIDVLKTTTDKGNLSFRYYKQNIYPEIDFSEDDIYVITTQGDRYDLLAQQFYGDFSLWWIISLANYELSFDSIFIPIGTQLRIPVQVQQIISKYNKMNKL